MRNTAFVERISRDRPLLIDGRLATQLEHQGCDIGNALWSASLLIDNSQAIVRASRAFLDAGAECIATASYQASREGFAAELVRRVCAVVPGKAVIAYPNSGEIDNVEDNSWSGTAEPLDYAAAAEEWVAAGARIVGGCCRTAPAHIRALRDAISGT